MSTQLVKSPDSLSVVDNSRRSVILHYHFFKNAGTSIDAALKESLGKGGWVTREFSADRKKNQLEIKSWLQTEKTAVAFSSHTAQLPIPEIEGFIVLPVVFLRHPLDRIASAYLFESKQNNRSFGSTLAKHTQLAGYIDTRLAIGNDKQCRNFHANRLAQMFPEKTGSLFERAERAINELPFIGLVEHYNDSILRLNQCLEEFGLPNVKLQARTKNMTRGIAFPLSQKLKNMRKSIGGSLYDRLLEENAIDIELHRIVEKKYLECAEVSSADSA